MKSSQAIRIVGLTLVLVVLPTGLCWAAQDMPAPAQTPATTPEQVQIPAPPQAAPAAPATTQAAPPSEGQALHILVGKSVVVNVQSPITRVLSSNPAVIETLATSPTEIVVEGRAAGTSSLILWDQSGRSQMLDVIVDLDVTGLRTAITRAYPKGEVDVQADGLVQIRFHGACHGCPSSTMTLQDGIQRNLREKVPEVTRVVPVT